MLADVQLLVASTLIVHGTRRVVGAGGHLGGTAAGAHVGLLLIFAIVLLLRLGIRGEYEAQHRFNAVEDFVVLLREAFMSAAIATFVALATKGLFTGYTSYSRAYVAYGLAVPTILLLGGRLIGRSQQRSAFREGNYLARSLIVGGGERAEGFLEQVLGHPELGLLPTWSEVAPTTDLDAFEKSMDRELTQLRPHEVVLAFDEPHPELQDAVTRQAAFRGIAVKTLPGVFDNYRSSVFEYEGVPITTLYATPGARFARSLKRAFDLVSSLLGLLVLSPFFVLVAVLIKLEGGGPVFYRQPRVGFRGKTFSFWKFRSMRVNGDAILDKYLADHPEHQEQWDKFQKLPDDPRVTKIGGILRKTSMDELPQLFNVLVGEMSLVGPRPPIPHQIEDYGEAFVFSQARPGITGLWQVSGRNEIDFQGRIGLEAYYVENWSFWLDIRILLKTVGVVARGSGAY